MNIASREWRKPLLFACFAALGGLLAAAAGEVWLGVTQPPPTPPPPPPPAQAIVLVLDTSGSMEGAKLAELQTAARAYVARQDLQRDRVAIVHFDTNAEVGSPLTHDPAALNAAVNALSIDGMTRMDLGLELGQRQFEQTTETRNMLLFTDGVPEAAEISTDAAGLTLDAATQIRANGTRLIAIATGDADTDYLAKLTGDPTLVFRAESGQFGEAFQKVQKLLAPVDQLIDSRTDQTMNVGLALLRLAVWTGLIGLFVACALIGAQRQYAREPMQWNDALGALGGLAAGCAAGAIGQLTFGAMATALPGLAVAGRLVAWALLGGGLGWGMALFIPNLRADRAALGGALGGLVGAVAFISAAALGGDAVGRWSGAAVVGFSIGFMLVFTEIAFRDAWLHVRYGSRDEYDLNLGAAAIRVGSDRLQCRIFAAETPPLAAIYGIENGTLTLKDAGGARSAIAPGDTRTFGNVTITVHAKAGSDGPGRTGFGGPSPYPIHGIGPTVPPAVSPLSVPPQTMPQTRLAASPIPKPATWVFSHPTSPIPLPRGEQITMGRGPQNQIVLADASVSGRHAQLQVRQDTLIIIDLGSTNGTFINDSRLSPNEPKNIRVGDRIKLGKQEYIAQLSTDNL